MNPFLRPTVAKPAHLRSDTNAKHNSIKPQAQSAPLGAPHQTVPACDHSGAVEATSSPQSHARVVSLRSVPISAVAALSVIKNVVTQQVACINTGQRLYFGRLRQACLRYTPTIRALVIAIGSALVVVTVAHAVEVNTADTTALQALRGVGPKMAEQIVEERKRGGDFMDVQDLQERVRGMGPKTIQRLLDSGLTVTVQKQATSLSSGEKSK